MDTTYAVVAAHDDTYDRTELRVDDTGLSMVRLRRRVGGGWYVIESIGLPLDDAAREAFAKSVAWWMIS